MAEPAPARLATLTVHAMVLTDVGFVVYWLAVALRAVPPSAMFADYADPRVAAWNWSFLPLDAAASALGLAAARAVRQGHPAATARLTAALALTATAGGMAVGYWLLLGEVDPAWLAPNLFLLTFPLPLLTRLLCGRRP